MNIRRALREGELSLLACLIALAVVVAVIAVQTVGNRLPDDAAAYAAWVAFQDDPRAPEIAAFVASDNRAALSVLAEAGDPEAQAALGELLCGVGRIDEARHWYVTAAAQGHPPSLAVAVVMSAPGANRLADPSLAAASFRRLNRLQGYASSQGLSPPPAVEALLESLCVAPAERELAKAFVALVTEGRLVGSGALEQRYVTGDGVSRNLVEAYAIAVAYERYVNRDSGPRYVDERLASLGAELGPDEIAAGRRRADAWYEITRGRG
ncbi:MAG: hypothetical protein KIT43_10170 [Bauldia sp.]|nr:hypothetical protein [Bauldia sp.]